MIPASSSLGKLGADEEDKASMSSIQRGDTESGPASICPVTGMPILRKPEWPDIDYGNKYRATLSVLGDSILLSEPSGYCRSHDMKKALELSSKVANEAISVGRPFVQIEDLSNVPGGSLEARKRFIDYLRKHERLLGLIFCGASLAQDD